MYKTSVNICEKTLIMIFVTFTEVQQHINFFFNENIAVWYLLEVYAHLTNKSLDQ